MTRPFFSKDRISDFENFGRHADATIISIKERLREGYAVDFQVDNSVPSPYRCIDSGTFLV